ncbi:MAG: 23S rRNA (guanosine(2251)-2'-O)-methyltransferase RlmB [Flavobacteriales bacterium]|nr:23S rRNA (guanosine(2251)-2'-O)-methyltransferase RlmB [Flavobacteriales bacterium]
MKYPQRKPVEKFEGEEKDLVFGIRPVQEALTAGKEIDKLYMQKGLTGDGSQEVIAKARELHIHIHYVPKDRMDRITRKNHQGVVAFISPIRFQSLELLVPMIFEKGETPLFIILDRITDVRNMGAIIRTAVCAGAHGVVFPDQGAARVSNETVRTSAGAAFSIPLCKVKSLTHACRYLQDSGIQLIGCTEKASKDIYGLDMKEPSAIILGSEEDGISEELLKMCHQKGRIPLAGPIASLNVSVATGVVLFESIRQRQTVSQ